MRDPSDYWGSPVSTDDSVEKLATHLHTQNQILCDFLDMYETYSEPKKASGTIQFSEKADRDGEESFQVVKLRDDGWVECTRSSGDAEAVAFPPWAVESIMWDW